LVRRDAVLQAARLPQPIRGGVREEPAEPRTLNAEARHKGGPQVMISDHGSECDALAVSYKIQEFWDQEVHALSATC
jgi:hypothetical protein